MDNRQVNPAHGGGGSSGSKADAARDQGRQVADHASEQARQVADTAGAEAGNVVDEAREQVSGVMNEAQRQLRAQADEQTHRLGGALGGLGDRLQALADGRPEEAGPIGEYAETIAAQTRDIAGRIDDLGFDGVLDEVQRFARRRPGAFLIGAAVAGFASSRLGRGAKEADSGRGPEGRAGAGPVGAPPVTRQAPPPVPAERRVSPPTAVTPPAGTTPPGAGTTPPPAAPGQGEGRR
jgi:hypothetical protein